MDKQSWRYAGGSGAFFLLSLGGSGFWNQVHPLENEMLTRIMEQGLDVCPNAAWSGLAVLPAISQDALMPQWGGQPAATATWPSHRQGPPVMMSITAVVGRLTPVSTHIKYNTLAAGVEAGDPSASMVTMLPVGGPAVAASALPGGKVARPVGCAVAPVSSPMTPSTDYRCYRLHHYQERRRGLSTTEVCNLSVLGPWGYSSFC